MKLKLIRDLQALFEKVPNLVNKYESQDSGFVESVKKWFKEAEDLLRIHRIHRVGELAGLRGTIEAAERGVYDNTFFVEPGMRSSKAAAAIASLSLNKAQDILHHVLEPVNRKFEEAGKILRPIVVIAGQLNIIARYSDSEGGLTIPVEEFWKHLGAMENIRDGLMRVLTFISYPEAIFLMKEILDELPSHIFNPTSRQLNPTPPKKIKNNHNNNKKEE